VGSSGSDSRKYAPLSIGIELLNTKGGEECHQRFKALIFEGGQDIGQHVPSLMVNRVPQPPLLSLGLHKAPHFIHLSLQANDHRRDGLSFYEL